MSQPNKPMIIKKYLYITLASIFVALGAVGIFLPLLPTTPFLLLSAYFYMNSSRKHLRWLLNHKYLDPYIKSYLSKEGIPARLKARTITIMWLTMLSTIIFATDKTIVRIILFIIASAVTIHILSKKTKKE